MALPGIEPDHLTSDRADTQPAREWGTSTGFRLRSCIDRRQVTSAGIALLSLNVICVLYCARVPVTRAVCLPEFDGVPKLSTGLRRLWGLGQRRVRRRRPG